MLINATQEEELRMAMVDGQRLYDLNIELSANERKKANIYKGKITRIEPSLEAAFVDFGADRHGFLPLKEISSEYFVKPVESGGKPSIKDVLNEGQDIVVQIDKEERGNKGAALTTFVSLAGRFIVLKPNKSRSGGVSRRIVGSDRDLARKSLSSIEVPKGMSVILRTAGIDRSPEELAWDLENLLTIWHAILNVVLERQSPFLIYRESNSVVRALRDYLTTEIGEILIDDDKTYREAHEFVEQVMPHNLRKLKHYQDSVPLFTRFQIESQIESAFTHSVHLPSGGSVVIDHTEALVSIDINSARATKGGDIEATALNTNLEAADEIGRQLRIRDLGGLIVIDFIDMGPQKHQREVENRLREAVRQDRARVQIGKISRFGLLEMSRQRLRPSLGESSYLTCPRCSGIGTIRSIESLALAILRIIGEEARKERTAKVIAQLPVEVATYLLNEKRDWVQNLESSNEMQVVLVANPALETPHYEVRRVRDDQAELPENAGASYALADAAPEPEAPQAILERKAVEPAAIAVLKPSKPAPQRKAAKSGLLARIASLFSGDDTEKASKKKKPARRKKAAGKVGRSRSKQQRGKKKPANRRADEQRPTRKKRTKKKSSKKKTVRKTAAKKTPQSDEQTNKPQTAAQEAREDASSGEERKPSRSRRSRGGRRRRRPSDKPRTGAAEGTTKNENEATTPKPAAAEQRSGEISPSKQPPQARREPADSKPDGNRAPQAQTDTDQAADAGKARSAEARPKRGGGASTAAVTSAEESGTGDQPFAAGTEAPSPEKSAGKSKPPVEAREQADQATEAASEPRAKPQAKPSKQPEPEGRLLPWESAQSPAPTADGTKPEPPSGD
jgi:ribonuclease E